MTTYSDAKNPYHDCDNNHTCDSRDGGASRCGDYCFAYYFACERKELWEEGYLAAEKELAFTEEEKEFASHLLEQDIWNYFSEKYEEALLSICKKVLGA